VSGVSLFMVTIVVPDMDVAISHYTDDWGFSVTCDTSHASGHRWVEVTPGGGARIRLVEASDEGQRSVIGRQAGGRVAFFLRLDAFDTTIGQWTKQGIEIVEPVRLESYGRIIVMRDKFGNRWDVLDARFERAA
jgi:uncharacterized glyoxalase superfamily protein PhnB